MAKRAREWSISAPLILLMLFLYGSTYFLRLKALEMPRTLFLERWVDVDLFFSPTVLSAVLAFVFLVLITISLYFYANAFTTKINFSLPPLYLAVVLANPNVCLFSPFHIVALLLIWTLYCSSSYRSFGQGFGALFLSFFLIGCASLFYVPILWLAIVFFAVNLKSSEEKLKYIVTSIVGLIFPLLMVFAVEYLIYDYQAVVAIAERFVTQLIDVGHKGVNYAVSEICRVVFGVYLVLISMVFVIRHLDRYKTSTARAYMRVFSFLLAATILFVIFITSNKLPFGVVLQIPTAIILHEYLSSSEKRHRARTLFYIYFALIAVERVLLLIS